MEQISSFLNNPLLNSELPVLIYYKNFLLKCKDNKVLPALSLKSDLVEFGIVRRGLAK